MFLLHTIQFQRTRTFFDEAALYSNERVVSVTNEVLSFPHCNEHSILLRTFNEAVVFATKMGFQKFQRRCHFP